MVALAAGTIFAGSAIAQPVVDEDFGTVSAGVPITRTTASTGPTIRWYKFTLPTAVQMSDLSFLNLNTAGSAIADTEIGLYNDVGNFIATDDDEGPSSLSALSFGSGDNTFPGGAILSTNIINNGRDKNLPAGTYYVALGSFNVTFNATNWSVTTTGTSTTAANLVLNLSFGTAPALAVPAGTIDLGTVASGGSVTNSAGSLSTGQRVQWYRVTVPQGLASAGTFVDMDTEGTLLTTSNTTRMVIYNATGALQSNTEFGTLSDLTDGSGSLSQLTFGATAPARPAVGTGLAYNGRDGSLQAGTYLIAVAGTGVSPTTSSSTIAQSFGFTSTSTNVGPVTVKVAAGAPSVSPTITGQAASVVAGGSTVIRATVVGGANPTSPIASVIANGTILGLGSSIALNDSGLLGDVLAGDNIWSTTVSPTVPDSATAYAVPVTVTDGIPRTGTGTINVTVQPAVPSCPPADTTQSFPALVSTATQGSAGNSVVTTSFGTGVADKLRLTGRLTSVVGTSWRSEARIRVTGPSGTVYNIQPFTTTGTFSFADITTPIEISVAGENAAGTWTIETFESFDDSGVDANWNLCFGVTYLTAPTGTCPAGTNTAVEGTTANLSLTVNPVAGVSVASVVMDASSINPAATAVVLTDPDNDNIFTGTTTATVLGSITPRTLPYVVTGSNGLTNSGSCNITITSTPTGACCAPTAACSIISEYACSLASGTFAGAGTNCGAQNYPSGPGTGAFASIAATGTPVFPLASIDIDDDVATGPLPFPFTFYGNTFNSINIVSNGFANFGTTSTAFGNAAIPSAGTPNNAIYPFWDDLAAILSGTTNVFVQTDGVAPSRTFTISWENIGQYATDPVTFDLAPVGSNSFQVVLFEGSNNIEFRYGAVDAFTAPLPSGTDTITVGVENAAGTVAVTIATADVGAGNNAFLLDGALVGNPCTVACDTIDFNQNGVFPEDQDVVDFFDVLAGGTPATCDAVLGCQDIDFNNNGVFPEDQDVVDFFNVLAGGTCPQ